MSNFPTRFDFTEDELSDLADEMLGDDVSALIARGRFVAHSWHRRSQDESEPAAVRQFAGDIASLQSEMAEALAVELAKNAGKPGPVLAPGMAFEGSRIVRPADHPAPTMTELEDGSVRWDCNCGREHDDGCYVVGSSPRRTCPFFAFNLHEDTLQTQPTSWPTRFKSPPEPGTRVELNTSVSSGSSSRGVVVEPIPTDGQSVNVRWDDGLTTSLHCEQLRPDTQPLRPSITRNQFIASYGSAPEYGLARLRRGYVALPCDCGHPSCRGWGMTSIEDLGVVPWGGTPEQVAEALAHRDALLAANPAPADDENGSAHA